MPSRSSSITSHSKMSDNTPPPNNPDDGERGQFNDSGLDENNTTTTQSDEEEPSDNESTVPRATNPPKKPVKMETIPSIQDREMHKILQPEPNKTKSRPRLVTMNPPGLQSLRATSGRGSSFVNLAANLEPMRLRRAEELHESMEMQLPNLPPSPTTGSPHISEGVGSQLEGDGGHIQSNQESGQDEEEGEASSQTVQEIRRHRSRPVDVEDGFLSTDRYYFEPVAMGILGRIWAANLRNRERATDEPGDTSAGGEDGKENVEEGPAQEAESVQEEGVEREDQTNHGEGECGENPNKEEDPDEGENQGEGGDGKNPDGEESSEGTGDEDDTIDNNSVNSHDSLGTQVPPEDQPISELEEAASGSEPSTPSGPGQENFPPLRPSSPAPTSSGPAPQASSPEQVSPSSTVVNTPSSNTSNNGPSQGSPVVRLANLMGPIIDPDPLPLDFSPAAPAPSNSATATSSSRQTEDPFGPNNLTRVGSQFEELNATGEESGTDEERGYDEDHENDSDSDTQSNSGNAPTPLPPLPPSTSDSSSKSSTPPPTELESGWIPNRGNFGINRSRCPMCVRRGLGFIHPCHGGPPCDACTTLGYTAKQCRTGVVGEGGGGKHERPGRKRGKKSELGKA
jgi:hypothetical protein